MHTYIHTCIHTLNRQPIRVNEITYRTHTCMISTYTYIMIYIHNDMHILIYTHGILTMSVNKHSSENHALACHQPSVGLDITHMTRKTKIIAVTYTRYVTFFLEKKAKKTQKLTQRWQCGRENALHEKTQCHESFWSKCVEPCYQTGLGASSHV